MKILPVVKALIIKLELSGLRPELGCRVDKRNPVVGTYLRQSTSNLISAPRRGVKVLFAHPLGPFRGPLIAALTMGGSVLAIGAILPDVPVAVRLATMITTGVVVYGVVMWTTQRHLVDEVRQLMSRA